MDKVYLNSAESRAFLKTNLIPDLKDSMRDLLGHIHQSGFLNKYWHDIDKMNKKAVRRSIRTERARQRLVAGSEYNSGNEEKLDDTEKEEDSWSQESSAHETSSIIDDSGEDSNM